MTVTTNKYNDILMFALKASILFLMFNSLRLYFTWNIPDTAINSLVVIVCFFFLISHYKSIILNNKTLVLCFVFFLIQLYELFFSYDLTLPILIKLCSALFSGILVILLRLHLKIDFLSLITKITAVIVAISLIGWIFFLFRVNLPHYYSETDAYYSHTVYYLFLLNGIPELQLFPRFAGFFLEPGHLGTTSCFLLFINRFNLKKWENIVLLTATLLSLSLAAYGLLIGGIALFFLLESKHPILFSTFFVVFITLTFHFFLSSENDENAINEKILSRLEYSEGDFAGNNRYSQFFEIQYAKYIKTDKKYTGIRREVFTKDERDNWTLGSAGWKRYVLLRGIIGTMLIIFFYAFYLIKYYSSAGLGLFILFFVANMIRDYPLSEYWLLIYLFAIPVLKQKSSMIKIMK